jgi:hypothetical protein
MEAIHILEQNPGIDRDELTRQVMAAHPALSGHDRALPATEMNTPAMIPGIVPPCLAIGKDAPPPSVKQAGKSCIVVLFSHIGISGYFSALSSGFLESGTGMTPAA